MRAHTRLIAALIGSGIGTSAFLIAQAPQAQGQPPAAPAPAGQAPPDGRGAGRGGPGGGPAGGRRGGFTQFTRELASQDVIVRGKALYENNCASCHATDMRGKPDGTPNLLRSGRVFNDQHGELVAASVSTHKPTLNLVAADTTAIAEYLHSVQATMGGQGSPPGGRGTGAGLNLLVGNAAAGQTAFGTLCASCHSVTGDLKGIGTKFPDPRTLQNAWVAGTAATFGGFGGGRGDGGGGQKATVTMADGSKIEGTLVRQNDFMVILTLADGTRKSMARANGVPKVDVVDPQAAHKAMALKLDDPENKKMHDITAYLATIK